MKYLLIVERNIIMNPQNIGTSYPILKYKNRCFCFFIVIGVYINKYRSFRISTMFVGIFDELLSYLFVNGPTNGFVIS